MASPVLDQFMRSPLVTWIKTFEDEDAKPLSYDQLRDGVLLYNVWLQIDPHPPFRGVAPAGEDGCTRLRNLDLLLHNIKAFYEDVLGQLLVTGVPDILLLARGPDEASVVEMQTLLLLVLSSAVQCERKQFFIERIKTLDVTSQHTIMECIQRIADNPEAVWSAEWSDLQMLPTEEHDHMYSLCVRHLRNLTKERDELAERIVNLTVDQEGETGKGVPGPEKPHLMVELADVKSKLRKMQQELEEKNESLTEAKEELEESRDAVNRLRQENLELIQEARTAVAYRDEIDILTERVRKMDRLESEIHKYREKLNELDFYKSRVEELREDNRILVETKLMLEEQLEGNGKKTEQMAELETEMRKVSSRLKDMVSQRELDQKKIQELLEENARLQVDRKTAAEELAKMQAELFRARNEDVPSRDDSLLEQINTDAQTRALQLELENRRLRMLVENCNRESAEDEQKPCVVDLETHKRELEKLVEEMRQNMKVDQAHCEQMERTVNALTTENQKLQRVVETNQIKLEEIQEELQGLENENRKLNKTLDTLKLSIPKLHELEREAMGLNSTKQALEQEKRSLEKENAKLKQLMEARECTIDEYLSKLSLIEQKNQQLQKESENCTRLTAQLQELERENKELLQQASVEKKTLSSLQEELVNEKLKCQQLAGDLQKINAALKMEKSLPAPTSKKEERMQSSESRAVPRREIELPDDDDGNDATGHILRLKSLIAELDQRMTELEEENRKLLEENVTLIEQNDKKNMQTDNLEESLKAAVEHNAELQASLAKLEVEMSLLESRHDTVSSQNSRLQAETASLEAECGRLKQKQHETQEANESLIRDQKTLQSLHQQLSSDFDSLLSSFASFKLTYKTLKTDHLSVKERAKATQDRYEQLLEEQGMMQRGLETLRAENERLNSECEELRGQLTTQGLESTRLAGRCEALTERNNALEEEQKVAVAQLSLLLVQYHELLTQVLKQQGRPSREDVLLKERLRELWQQKEQLERAVRERCHRRTDSAKRKQNKKATKRQEEDSEGSGGGRSSRRKTGSRPGTEDAEDYIPVRGLGSLASRAGSRRGPSDGA
ncbi:girdin [Centruroides vittatus]|uniref:girdin n=1 Tax=Centruroides vittatus TaxID=120091 RepID=UPI00350EAFE3